MKILTDAIVSNSDMFKNYKMCRETSEKYGKVFILKNNQPDAVLFSIGEYKKISALLEYLDCLDDQDAKKLLDLIPGMIPVEA
jgi:PHD/YefM family antitoxin component YafN of YafNO toxin-antitoxin module